MKSVLVLSGGKTRTQDRNLAATATRFGAVVDVAELTDVTSSDGGQLWARMASSTAVATSADSLAALCRDERSRAIALEQFLGMDALFVYGVVPQVHDELIKWISAGKLEAARPIEAGETCDLPEAGRAFTRQLAGSSFAREKGAKASGVVVSEGDGVTPLLTVSLKPTFVHVQGPSSWQGGHQPRSLFVSTAVEFPDPNQPMAAEEDIDAFYETLVPQLVFVRAVCGEFCWHGALGTARLIIDDPVLRRVYGYLDFARLFESVRRHGYAASVAYIPWNYTRTQKDRAAFFRAAGAQFSLCVHGCDHTNDEYGGPDEAYLSQKSSLAMDRMRRHEARTGMPFEPVMVFPQGRFSTAGLRGLRSSGFLAAINSSRFPVDVDAAPLSLWDFSSPRACGHTASLCSVDTMSSRPFLSCSTCSSDDRRSSWSITSSSSQGFRRWRRWRID